MDDADTATVCQCPLSYVISVRDWGYRGIHGVPSKACKDEYPAGLILPPRLPGYRTATYNQPRPGIVKIGTIHADFRTHDC